MSRRVPEELSVGELEQLLIARRAAEREQRLGRARAEGRLVVPDAARATNGADATPDEARIAAALVDAIERGELVAGPAARSFLAGALAALDAARTGQAIEPPDLNR